METKMSLMKKFAVVATMVAPLLLAGCGRPATSLCPENEPGIGQTSYSLVFNGAAQTQKVCTVDAGALHEQGNYTFRDGLLDIRGNVPKDAWVSVRQGKVLVEGNVGQKAYVEAQVPENTHNVTYYIPMKIGKAWVVMPITHTVFDGFKYVADHDSAVLVRGTVDKDAKIVSNHGIYIGQGFSAAAKLSNTRDGQQVSTGNAVNGMFIAPLLSSSVPPAPQASP
jgi:hypothetical protein